MQIRNQNTTNKTLLNYPNSSPTLSHRAFSTTDSYKKISDESYNVYNNKTKLVWQQKNLHSKSNSNKINHKCINNEMI